MVEVVFAPPLERRQRRPDIVPPERRLLAGQRFAIGRGVNEALRDEKKHLDLVGDPANCFDEKAEPPRATGLVHSVWRGIRADKQCAHRVTLHAVRGH